MKDFNNWRIKSILDSNQGINRKVVSTTHPLTDFCFKPFSSNMSCILSAIRKDIATDSRASGLTRLRLSSKISLLLISSEF